MPVKNELRQLRGMRGIAVADLARRAGISRQALYAIENGSFVPNTVVSLQLARALDVPVEEIFSLRDEPASAPVKAEVLGGDSVLEGQFVKLCRVNRRMLAAPISFLPSYLPVADGLVQARSGRTVRIDSPSGVPEEGTRLLVAGCDPALSLLSASLGSSEIELVSVSCSSRRALEWLKQGRVHAAGCHLLDRASGEYNVPIIRRLFSKTAVRVITFAIWEQGLVVRRGNPKSIRNLADLARKDVRVVNRERGAGSRELLDHGLRKLGIQAEQVRGYDCVANGHLAAAYTVVTGTADCCVAPRAAARCFGLDFVPLAIERFDLSFSRATLNLAAGKAVMDALNRSQLRKRLQCIAGYDTAHTGEVVV